MKRRKFLQLALLSGAASSAQASAAARETDAGPTSTMPSRSHIIEATVADLQARMHSGSLTSQMLVKMYRDRIRDFDMSGPRINSVIELNPDASAIAMALDRERKAKEPRGPLHGIPVLLKDNIATADKMQTTAGSLALVGARPVRDAFLVTRLRNAGAVILGKTNLSEWANFRSTRSTSGWSARGGLTKNPYALDRNANGSSSGSGAAIAASFAAVAVGTETDGSIIAPAATNGLVGVKPTVGLISRNGIIPIAQSQDTAGPMTRTVADAAVLLSAMAGVDPRDAATSAAAGHVADYTRSLDRDGLRGARIGVVRKSFAGNDQVAAVMTAALDVLKARGATLVDPVEVPNVDKFGETELEVLLFEFKAELAAYLAEFTPGAKIRTLKDVIAFNEANRKTELRYFGQELFLRAEAKAGLDSAEYRDALARNVRNSRAEGVDQVMQEHKLDAIVGSTVRLPWLTDFINGDPAEPSDFTSAAAVAGYPHFTVPAGQVHGLPVGLSFVAGAWAEPTLFKFAYAFEQATKLRRAPTFVKSVNL